MRLNKKVEGTQGIMRSVSALLNKPTETVFPASEVSKNTLDKGHCFDRLVDLVKGKLDISNNKQQIQLPTLAWCIGQVVEVFETTEYKAKKAKKPLQEKGLLVEPENNEGKCLSNIVSLAQSFHEGDRFSICLPGTKDFVSIENKEYKQNSCTE